MRIILDFIGEVFRKSVLAFFVTVSVCFAFSFPIIFLIGVSAASASKEVPEPGLSTRYVYGKEASANKILIVPVTGVIYGDSESDGDSTGFLESSGNTYGYNVKRILRKAAQNPNIKAVILEINSPGGTIYGSQAIADAVSNYKERTKQPVYAHITGLAASGAYWAAVGSDKIIADLGSSIGSIGVINGGFVVYNSPIALDNGILSGGVTTRDGIEAYYITSGKGKDLGNPFRKPTDEELSVLQRGADNNYKLFVKRVSEQRKIDADTIVNEIGAYIYDNETAIERRLIDMTGSREVSYAELAKAAKIESDYQVVTAAEKKSKLESLLEVVTTHKGMEIESVNSVLRAELCVPHRPLAYYGDLSVVCSQ